ncbi:choice-of-anchor J domain-containing protein [Dokdonella sp. MW10]|uniref:choice-of-anchor J domain-containing protein n=1 Tax=Dokdonella sp. MW10 TaxID=2992926 RepID=UPI003F7FC314
MSRLTYRRTALLAVLSCATTAVAGATSSPFAGRAPTLVEMPTGTTSSECVEGFEHAESLFTDGGWLRANTSTEPQDWDHLMTPGKGFRWEQKIEYLDSNVEGLLFNAHAGTPHSVVFASLYSHSILTPPPTGPATGVLSNWLITPPITFAPGATLGFWTRKGFYDFAPIWGARADRMIVRLCMDDSGDCTDVGEGPNDVGGFTTTLLSINPDLGTEDDATGLLGYPYGGWRRFTIGDLPASGTGRIAFHYHVPEAMDIDSAFAGGGKGNMIALDTVELDGTANCPLKSVPLFSAGFERDLSNALTQNLDTETITSGLSVACITQTRWLRRFDLDGDFGRNGRLDVASVDIGVMRAYSSVPIHVRLYRIAEGAEFTYANLVQVGSHTITVNQEASGRVLNIPVTGTIPDASTQDLVVEIVKPDFNREFWPGFNQAIQTAPTYVSFDAENCGLFPEPTNLENVPGAPDASLLMIVNLADPSSGP